MIIIISFQIFISTRILQSPFLLMLYRRLHIIRMIHSTFLPSTQFCTINPRTITVVYTVVQIRTIPNTIQVQPVDVCTINNHFYNGAVILKT